MAVTLQDQIDAKGLRQCGGTSRSTGQRCRRRIRPPKLVCSDHGGKPSIHKQRADAFDGVDMVAAMKLYDPDAPAVTNPYLELQKLGGIARNARDVAGQKVNELKEWDDVDDEGRSQLKVEINLLMQLMKMCETIFATLAKLKIDERVAEVEAAKTALIGAALDRAFGRVSLSVEQRSALDAAFAGELRAITSGRDLAGADETTLFELAESLLKQKR